MGSRGTENTICISSANRDVQAYPHPSDFMCELKQRFDCQMIVLGSLELPLTQYLIEEEWSRFYFDVGLAYPLQEARTLYVAERPYTQALLTLPAPYTPMLYLGPGADGRLIWRVSADVQPIAAHGLVAGSLTVLPSTRIYHSPSKPPLMVQQVLSLDSVLTGPLPPDATLPVGGAAVLVCAEAGARTFCNAEQLCEALNVFFADSFVNLPLRLRYDCSEMALALTASGDVSVNTSLPNLLQSLCIPTQRGIVPLGDCRSTRFPGAQERAVPVGNYEFNLMRQQLEILLNPLLQFGSIQSVTVGVYVFGNPPGGAVSVALGGFLLYDPKAVALALSRQMRAALPSPVICFDFVDDAFEIYSDAPFRIFWGDTRLGMQLGFDADLKLAPCHRGTSRLYLAVPTAVYLPATFEGESTAHLRRLVLATRGRVQAAQTGGVEAEARQGCLWVPIGTVPCEYLVGFPQPAGHALWAVATTSDATAMPGVSQPLPEWSTKLLPLTALPSRSATAGGTVVPFFGGAANVYFPAPTPAVAPRLAEILGFLRGANLWPVAPPLPRCCPSEASAAWALVAPSQVCLDIPSYILLEIGIEHMSANIYHRVGADLRTALFAKIPTYGGQSSFKWESRLPASKTATGTQVVTQFRIRLLNPFNHSLYNTHGRNWSCTITLASQKSRVATECA